jgi:hypothetical protein
MVSRAIGTGIQATCADGVCFAAVQKLGRLKATKADPTLVDPHAIDTARRTQRQTTRDHAKARQQGP